MLPAVKTALRRRQPPPPLSTSTETFLASLSAAPALEAQLAYDRVIRRLQGGTLWGKCDVLTLYSGLVATRADACKNLRDPTKAVHTFTEPTTAVGWAPISGLSTNGSDNFVDTGFNPTTFGGQFTQNSASIGLWYGGTATTFSSAPVGFFDGTDGTTFNPRTTGNAFGARVNQAAQSTSNGAVSPKGFKLANRRNSTGFDMFVDGLEVAVTAGNDNQTSTALNNSDFFIGRSSAANFVAIDGTRALWLGSSLLGPENRELYDILWWWMQVTGVPATL